MLLLCLSTMFFVLLGVSNVVSHSPRGVPMSHLKKYEVTQTSTHFACDEHKSISFKNVNDGYCDCPGGQDEPGTSACSHITTSQFYCINKGHRGKWLPSSRVDDNICDCCDGSDEISINCINSCEEESKQASEWAARTIRMLEEGARLKDDYIQKGLNEIGSREERLKVIAGELALSRVKISELEAKEKELQIEEERIRKERRFEANMKVIRRFPTLSSLGLDELRHLLVEYARRVDRRGKELMCLVTGNDDVCGKPQVVSDPILSEDLDEYDEYGGGMYGDMYGDMYGESYDSDLNEYENVMVLDEGQVDEIAVGDSMEGAHKNSETETAEEEIVSDYLEEELPYDLPELVSLRQLLKKERKVSIDMEKERDELEEESNIPPEFIPLKDQCFKVKQQAYTYEMCPFGSATQSGESGSTNLGYMQTYESAQAMVFHFTGGDYCYNGPIRSATVSLECGVDDELFEVEEPLTCEYTMKFRTPAACDVKHAKALVLDLSEHEALGAEHEL